jgi:hypothetical protein
LANVSQRKRPIERPGSPGVDGIKPASAAPELNQGSKESKKDDTTDKDTEGDDENDDRDSEDSWNATDRKAHSPKEFGKTDLRNLESSYMQI